MQGKSGNARKLPLGSRRTWAVALRSVAIRPMKAKPIRLDELRMMVQSCPATKRGLRDRCVLVLGFGASLTRAQMSALCVEHVSFGSAGITLRIGVSEVFVPRSGEPMLCPVRCTEDWLAVSGIVRGRLFRAVSATGRVRTPKKIDAGKLITRIVKSAARRCGLDPRDYSAHSLRCGIAASLPRSELGAVQRHGRWKTKRAVARYMTGEGRTG